MKDFKVYIHNGREGMKHRQKYLGNVQARGKQAAIDCVQQGLFDDVRAFNNVHGGELLKNNGVFAINEEF